MITATLRALALLSYVSSTRIFLASDKMAAVQSPYPHADADAVFNSILVYLKKASNTAYTSASAHYSRFVRRRYFLHANI